MSYQPLQFKGNAKARATTTLMSPKGMNLKDLPQLLKPDYAQLIVNYLLDGTGNLQKRKGLQNIVNVAGGLSISMAVQYGSDDYIFGYGTTVAAYSKSTQTVTTIKNDFSTNDGFDGEKYGDYFFVCNGVEKIHRISRTISYGTQTGNFTVGTLVTGATSGATASILEDNDSGATGVLTLGNVNGVFQSGEIITDTGSGSATTTSAVTFAIESITASPICKVIRAINARLFAGNLITDETATKYSNIDDGTNPPFDTWTEGTLADQAGEVNYRNAGAVNAIEPFANYIGIFSEKGKNFFYINTIDSAGTLSKVDVFQSAREDFGGARGALLTSAGLFYVNEGGLWQLLAVGQTDVPASEQEGQTSILLGNKYFDDATFDNADIAYDAKRRNILVTYAQNSAVNNRVLVYNIDAKTMSLIKEWNINRFLNDDQDLFGASSVATKIYQLFTGDSDDGSSIGTEYVQELNLGGLQTAKTLLGCYVQGFLSLSSVITVRFDIYDVTGRLIEDKLKYQWTTQYNSNEADGWGTAKYSESAWGGDSDKAGLVESFDGCRPFIRNFQRVKLHITSGDKLPHIINWASLEAKEKQNIRRRKLTKLTT